MPRVLITDGLWRKSLSVVRALGREGFEIGVTGDSWFITSFYSRYCSRRVRMPNGSDRPGLGQALLKELSSTSYDMILPMEDDTIQAIIERRDEVEALTRLPLPATASLRTASDKAATLAVAERLGIAVPITHHPADEDELHDLLPDLKFPAVVKPTHSSGSRGLRYAETQEELAQAFRQTLSYYGAPLVQERISGQGVGAALLFDQDHEPVAGFTYRRLREYPVTGGPSTLRESTRDPALLDTATTLLRELRWYGVAMVEFKMDERAGKPVLMEINPRFWGSVELAVASGVNFPLMLYKVAMGEKVTPVFDYVEGVQCRWLVPGDILHFISNPARLYLEPSFFRFTGEQLRYDDFSRDDIPGSLATVVCTAAQALRPEMWRLAITR